MEGRGGMAQDYVMYFMFKFVNKKKIVAVGLEGGTIFVAGWTIFVAGDSDFVAGDSHFVAGDSHFVAKGCACARNIESICGLVAHRHLKYRNTTEDCIKRYYNCAGQNKHGMHWP